MAAAFLVAAAIEGVVEPDRRARSATAAARLLPIRARDAGGGRGRRGRPAARQSRSAAAALLVAATAALGFFWAPAMAMLSDAAEVAGTHQGLAFALRQPRLGDRRDGRAPGAAERWPTRPPTCPGGGSCPCCSSARSRRSAAAARLPILGGECPTPPPTAASRSSSPVSTSPSARPSRTATGRCSCSPAPARARRACSRTASRT